MAGKLLYSRGGVILFTLISQKQVWGGDMKGNRYFNIWGEGLLYISSQCVLIKNPQEFYNLDVLL